jgi:hypothetical protein
MDAAKAELGCEDPRVARHNEVFDVAITGLADLVRLSPHDEMERMIAARSSPPMRPPWTATGARAPRTSSTGART